MPIIPFARLALEYRDEGRDRYLSQSRFIPIPSFTHIGHLSFVSSFYLYTRAFTVPSPDDRPSTLDHLAVNLRIHPFCILHIVTALTELSTERTMKKGKEKLGGELDDATTIFEVLNSAGKASALWGITARC